MEMHGTIQNRTDLISNSPLGVVRVEDEITYILFK